MLESFLRMHSCVFLGNLRIASYVDREHFQYEANRRGVELIWSVLHRDMELIRGKRDL